MRASGLSAIRPVPPRAMERLSPNNWVVAWTTIAGRQIGFGFYLRMVRDDEWSAYILFETKDGRRLSRFGLLDGTSPRIEIHRGVGKVESADDWWKPHEARIIRTARRMYAVLRAREAQKQKLPLDGVSRQRLWEL